MEGGHSYVGPWLPVVNNTAPNNNYFCYNNGDEVKPLCAMASGSDVDQFDAGSSSQWIQSEPRSYVEFLKESIADDAPPPVKVYKTVHVPVSGTCAMDDTSDVKNEPVHADDGKSFSLGSDNHHVEVEMLKLIARNSYNALMRSLKPENGGEAGKEVASFNHLTQTQQSETFCAQETLDDISNAFGVPSRESSCSLPVLSQPERSGTRRKDGRRQSRELFSQKLKALQELLPYPVTGQVQVLAAAVDYIKYMQLQMKLVQQLCQSRSLGEQTSAPFMFPEGQGNFFLHEQMMNEAMKGNYSLEMNQSAPTQLFGSTYMMPMPMPMPTFDGFHPLT